jgi:hypothetical protein
MTFGRAAMSSALSISSSGVTQTGQPGPWTNSIPGQQLVDAVADDGVGLAAADLHDHPRPGDHVRAISRMVPCTSSASRYSLTYFMALSGAELGSVGRLGTDLFFQVDDLAQHCQRLVALLLRSAG